MNQQKLFKTKTFIAGSLICLLLFIPPIISSQQQRICEQALEKCGGDAFLTLIFGGPQSFLAYYAGCLLGYSWCLKYFE